MIYLDRVETKWPLRIQLPIGTRVQLHCTASGKMYLSSLRPSYLDRYLDAARLDASTPRTLTDPQKLKSEIREIRKRGLATDNEEFMDGMVAIARPIHDDQGRLTATVSVHAPIQRISLDELSDYSDRLGAASKALSSLLVEDRP